jgi:hypothetical protein
MAEAVAVVRAVRRRKGHRAGHALWSLVASREFSHLRLLGYLRVCTDRQPCRRSLTADQVDLAVERVGELPVLRPQQSGRLSADAPVDPAPCSSAEPITWY